LKKNQPPSPPFLLEIKTLYVFYHLKIKKSRTFWAKWCAIFR